MADQVTVNIGGQSASLEQALDRAARAMDAFARAASDAGDRVERASEQMGSKLENNTFSRFGAWNMQTAALISNLKSLGSALQTVADLASKPLQWAWDLGQMALPYAQQGVQQAFGLDVTTQNLLQGWGYMFGNMQAQGLGGPNPSVVDVSGKSQAFYDWFSRFSMQIPTTRQDAMAAATSMTQIQSDANGDTLTPEQIEQYMPMLADIMATKGRAAYGGQGATLQQVAYAVLEASFGRSMMLRRDLFINPEELLQYGLDATGSGMGMHINDPSTLLPALQKYMDAHHLTGAARTASVTTWSGLKSSMEDRIQNLLTKIGGIEPYTDTAHGIHAGDVRPGSMFARMQSSLLGISKWMDDPQHLDGITKVADLFQNVLGTGVQSAGTALQGVLQGLRDSGAAQFLFDQATGFAQWLADPNTQKTLQTIGDTVGKFLGPAGQTVGGGIEGFLKGLKDSGIGDQLLKTVQDLGTWFSDPNHQKDVKHFFEAVGTAAGDAATVVDHLLQTMGKIAGPVVGGASDLIKQVQVMYGMKPQDEALLARQNPFVAPTDKDIAGMGFSQSYDWMKDISAHDWQVIVERAERDYLQQVYGSNTTDQAKAAYDAWIKQMQDAANGHPDATTPSYAPGYGPSATSAGIQNPLKAAQLAHRGLTPGGGALDFYTQAGQQSATTYLAAFTTTMNTQAPKTMSTAVTSYTTGMQAQLKNSGSTLAQDLAAYIAQAVQQGIADALRTMRVTGNGDLRQPGAYRSGGLGIGGAL